MPADETQHQHFVRFSASISVDGTQMSRRIYFVLWLFNRLQFQADEYPIPAQQQADERWLQFDTIFKYDKDENEKH